MQTGLIDSNCEQCKRAKMDEFRGCYDEKSIPAFTWNDYKFYNCPMHYLTHDTISWHDEYWAVKEGLCSLPKYGERQNRWYEAAMFYQGIMNKMQDESNKKRASRDRTDRGVKELIARFNSGKRH